VIEILPLNAQNSSYVDHSVADENSRLLDAAWSRAHSERFICLSIHVSHPPDILPFRRDPCLPWFLTRYITSTTTSISFTAALLKCFRTANASWSFGTRRLSFCRAIVGLCRPMPGLVSNACRRGEVKAEGDERLWAVR
jgi:hypothetical protein